jgi:hypothetical protein
MQKPTRYIIHMILFLAAVAALAALLYGTLAEAFLHNPALNSVILAVLVIGILYILAQTIRLGPEVEWTRTVDEQGPTRSRPDLLRSISAMTKESGGPPALPPVTLRSVLDGVALRLDESRELARYLTSLMIFLGLLGTFWGLIKTVGSVSAVIGSLDFSGTTPTQGFAALKDGLQAPLNGMGTAFSASLFGLSGSLILGFLDLQLGQAQSRFFRGLEDWLSGASKTTPSLPYLDGDVGSSHYLQALVEQTAENLDQLRQSVAGTNEANRATNHTLTALVEQLGVLATDIKLLARTRQPGDR